MNKPLHVLILFAFLMQAMIPLGFMPNLSAGSGGTALVICSGVEQKTIFVDDQGNTTDHERHSSVETPCAFATLASFTAPTPAVEFLHTQVVVASLSTQPDSQSFSPRTYLHPYAIGPPATL